MSEEISTKKSKKEEVIDAILNDPTIRLFTNGREQYMLLYDKELYILNKGLDDNIIFKIRKLARERRGLTLTDKDLNDIIEELNAIALDYEVDFKPKQRCFYNKDDYTFYYFTADEDWKVVKANEEEIRFTQQSKPMFIRSQNTLSSDVNIIYINNDHLTTLLNKLGYKEYSRYLKVVITAGFIDCISKPYLLFIGDEGSTKSTLADLIKEIIDNGVTKRVSLKRNISEIVLDIDENYVIVFDNISRLTKEQTDFFCIMYDTGGYTKRQLYTNNKQIRIEGRKFIIFTSINEPTKEKDFLDRSRILRFDRRRNNSRLSETEIRNMINAVIAEIRGECISAIAKAIPLIDKKHEDIANELRDNNLASRSLEWLIIWCEAIARVYGYEPLEFAKMDKEIYEKGRGIEDDLFKEVLLLYLEKNNKIEGYPKEIRDLLINSLKELDLNEDRRIEIKECLEELNAKKIGKRLQYIKSDLIERGYKVTMKHDRNGNRHIISKEECEVCEIR
ncbi:MAG: hypothetical protein KatS3mg003_2229 [Candidatus Nitrosocaldaceae archaeon]|nr:MAG: hypothetical protein KatS3mg003_2169 [Candidatus Nitrosocaldaceae archaeon]GIU72750.1 MAG: hypothetical protein KatS3mg003_2229 [Candidatus Nitrosocaldaceae archaeon]